MINLTELLADREQGTDGPWQVGMASGHNANLICAGGDDAIAQIYGIPTNWGVDDCQNSVGMPNARRIARLPDLEAAYIEAVELLRDIGGEGWLNADHYERARNFLGR